MCFFFQAEDGIRDLTVLEFRRVLFRSMIRHTRFDCDWSSDVCSSDLCCFGFYAWKTKQHADNQLLLDLFAEDSWRSVYEGELEVRPPGAPTTVRIDASSRPRADRKSVV